MPTSLDKRTMLRRIIRNIDEDLLDPFSPRAWIQGLDRLRPKALKALQAIDRADLVFQLRQREMVFRSLHAVDSQLIRPGLAPAQRGRLLGKRLHMMEQLEDLDA